MKKKKKKRRKFSFIKMGLCIKINQNNLQMLQPILKAKTTSE